MAKKIIYIVLGALLVFGLLFLLWSLFFGHSTNQNGSFGTASSTGQNGFGTAADNTNGQVPLGSNSSNGTVSLTNPTGGNNASNGTGGLSGGNNSGGNTGTGNTGGGNTGSGGSGTGGTGANTTSGGGVQVNTGASSVAGVNWLGGSSGTFVNANIGNGFSGTQINSVGGGSNGALPTFVADNLSTGGGGLSFLDALVAAGVIGTAVCGARAALATAAIPAGTAAGVALAAPGNIPAGLPVSDAPGHYILTVIAGQQGAQNASKAADNSTDFASCLLRVAAKAALQQMTASIVNWINSGFNGQPSFVQNYTQFFTNVADSAAGQFIQGSGLSFLCSAFKPQIRIAIAQSYANRGAQSCTLSRVINNVNNFMNGAFAQGGWQGFVSFTTMPLNNPYGSYAYAQISLGNAIQNAQFEKATGLSLGQGFLPVTKQIDCTGPLAPNAGVGPTGPVLPSNCKTVIVTPGNLVANSILGAQNNTWLQQDLAKSFDEIINAFSTQLITRTLQNGLPSLSSNGNISGTLSAAQQAALTQAQGLLNNMQTAIGFAQQYGSTEQGSIADIEQAQRNLSNLYNCSAQAASSSVLTAQQKSDAQTAANAAQAQIQTLELRVGNYNDEITRANTSITSIQDLQTSLATAATPADVQAVSDGFAALGAQGGLITQADVLTAQQNRTTLQAEMAALNQSTQTGLAQCQALH